MANSHEPPGWGEDPLSDFFGRVQHNSYGTFLGYRSEFNRLVGIDISWLRLIDNLDRPPTILLPLFASRAHSLYLSACYLAAGSLCGEVFPLLRTCLEFAVYAFHLNRHPELFEIWRNRSDSPQARRAVQDRIKIGNALTELSNHDQDLGGLARAFYNNAIDLGAHPNELSVFGGMRVLDRDEDSFTIVTDYLHPNTVNHELALKETARIGICSLEILGLVAPERFEPLGIPEQLEELKRGL